MTFRDCQTGAPIRTLRTRSTFSDSGLLRETGADDPTNQYRSGNGIWRHIGERNYITVSRFPRFHPDGTLAETEKVTRRIEILDDGAEFIATACIEVFDPDDKLIQSNCATATARRRD